MMKKVKNLLVLLLAAAMLLSLSACGEKKEEPGEEEEVKPDMVYTYESKRLDKDILPDGISPILFTDEGFYGLSYPNTYHAEVYDAEAEAAAAEAAAELGEAEEAGEPAEETGEPAEETGEPAGEPETEEKNSGPFLLFVSYDGAVKEMPAYKCIPRQEDPGDKTAFSSFSSMEALRQSAEGGLIAVESCYTYWFDGTEEERRSESIESFDKYKSTQDYYVRMLNKDGSEKSCAKLDIDLQDSWLYFYTCQIDAKGNLLVAGDAGVFCFGMDGSLLASYGGDIYLDGLIQFKDGSISARGWSDDGIALYPLDEEKQTLGKPIELANSIYDLKPGDESYDFYYMNGMYLYGYNMDEGEPVKVLNWLDVDLREDNLSGFHVLPDGTVYCVQIVYKNEIVDTDLVRIYKVPYDSVPRKEILKLAVISSDWAYDRVIDFNRRHDDVRIQIVDYMDFVDPESYDYDAAKTKLLTEVLSGSMPDLIAVNQLPYSQLASKGLLEDLYPYLDKDPELKREDFFPNVLKALEVNGGLYQLVPSFNVRTLMGARSVVGDKPGWSYQDLQDALATMPEGCSPLNMYTTRGDLLNTLLSANMSRFVDWTSGECHFNNQDFIDLLEFTKSFPAQIPDDLEWEDEETRISQGRQMLSEAYLSYMDNIVWYDSMFGAEGCTFIGYPTSEGVGSFMSTGEGYAMSAKCANKEAAWEFLRGFLSYENQKDIWNGIPLNLQAYQDKLKQTMTPNYERDENGKLLRDEDGKPIPISIGRRYREDGQLVEIYAMNQEQADRLWEALTTCDKLFDENDTICTIVYEQAQAFYSGQKSAEETARLIESKVTIYINEQR